ncbi:24217_t:CDS:2, partial [Entrophospora sp. SA101]
PNVQLDKISNTDPNPTIISIFITILLFISNVLDLNSKFNNTLACQKSIWILLADE